MTTEQTSTATMPAAAGRRITRDEILQLGRAGRPWEFLALAARALRQAPQDAEMQLLAAVNFARLGLPKPAREVLAGLPADVASDPGVIELSRAVEQLSPDALPPAQRINTCRLNIEALRDRGLDLREPFEQWSARASAWTFLRAQDGNVIRRPSSSREPTAWHGLDNQMAAAEQFVRAHVDAPGHDYHPPYVLESLDPPWLFLRLREHTPPTTNDYRTRITVLQSDPLELLDGLSLADLREAILDPRVVFFVGPDAGKWFDEDLRARFEAKIQGLFVGLPGIRTRVQPRADQILAKAQLDQQAEADRVNGRVRAIYANRDRSWWARRYTEAIEGSGRPLRVLIPTTRFSTYIQYASRDVAAAFRAIGAEAELLIEPDDSTRFSSLAFLNRLERIEPDLIVLINYTRVNTGEVFPPQVPFVCWIQDAMWHQFDEAVGSKQSAMDFLVGHIYPELFERFGYPRRNTLSMPVVANGRKFHEGPVAEALLKRHACEIAYVSHQSEAPQEQRDRLLAHQPNRQRCLEMMYPQIREIARDPMPEAVDGRLARLVEETLASVSGTVDHKVAAQLLRIWVQPMADRILRHQSLEWAAEVAERRGWRLRIYGRGWDRHPRLAAYAAGELPHDEELRASYRAAAVHLHLTINTVRHQRLMECVLSGGLPVCRRKCDDLWPILDYTYNRLVRDCVPIAGRVSDRTLFYAVADHPDAMAHTAVLQRYGLIHHRCIHLTVEEVERRLCDEQACLDRDDAWLLGDPADLTFDSPQDLEQIVERAVERPVWRTNVSRSIARRVRERYTTEHFTRQVIDLVRNSFSTS